MQVDLAPFIAPQTVVPRLLIEPGGAFSCSETRIFKVVFSMGKLGWTVVVILCIVVAADRYLNDSYYTDGTLALLRQIQHSFGW
jgi:hypothetical protein